MNGGFGSSGAADLRQDIFVGPRNELARTVNTLLEPEELEALHLNWVANKGTPHVCHFKEIGDLCQVLFLFGHLLFEVVQEVQVWADLSRVLVTILKGIDNRSPDSRRHLCSFVVRSPYPIRVIN